jgi:proteasome accessory factor A
MADLLIPFFVTRQIYCGAGKVLHGPRGAQFCIAQRAEHIWEGVSSATTRSRPIINTRDEPHADAERFRRLHVIVGDSNMNEWTTYMKVGITDLVLRMVEGNTVMRDLTLENPIRAIREISHDISCRKKVRLANGRELTAIEVQEEYYERTARFLERRGADPQSKQLLEEWRDALDALTAGEPEQLMRKVDWVAKHALIERYRLKHDLPLSHPRVALLDLAYVDVNRSRGLYHLLERQQRVERAVTEKEIQRAMREPPQTTRAKLRGDFIRQAKQKRRDYTVDWVHLKLNDQAQRTVLCKDPFRSVDERVEQLIAHM